MGISIKDLSERSGVKVPTIRYYERQGLLPEPEKTGGGQRRYGTVDVSRLRFVRFGRGLGLDVSEIRALIEMVGEGDGEAIVVLAETVSERAALLNAFNQSLLSVSAQIIRGEIDESAAFARLIDGDRGAGLPEEVAKQPNAASETGEYPEVIVASAEEAASGLGLDSAAMVSGANENAADPLLEERDVSKVPSPKPVRKRTRAKA